MMVGSSLMRRHLRVTVASTDRSRSISGIPLQESALSTGAGGDALELVHGAIRA